MLRAPFNHIPLPGGMTDAKWFALLPEQKAAYQKELFSLPSDLRYARSGLLNYEAAQCPLAYLLMMPVDLALVKTPLPERILVIRILITTLSTLACCGGAMVFSRAIGLNEFYRLVALVCIFETQMFWGTIAHVANDWLAVSATVVFFGCLAHSARFNSKKSALALAGSVTVGLLAKA